MELELATTNVGVSWPSYCDEKLAYQALAATAQNGQTSASRSAQILGQRGRAAVKLHALVDDNIKSYFLPKYDHSRRLLRSCSSVFTTMPTLISLATAVGCIVVNYCLPRD